jgi:RimJ/RimL family protein N-acetyltransferase
MNPLLLNIPEEIESERLLLRAPRTGDGAVVNASVRESFNELKRWMPWAQEIPTVEESEEFARRGRIKFLSREELPLMIFLKESSTYIGNTGLHDIDWKVPAFEIGYWLHSAHNGKGYMTEAVCAVTDFAFKALQAVRVQIRTDDHNQRSYRVAERAGFQLECVRRCDARDVAGALRDTRVYAKTASPD